MAEQSWYHGDGRREDKGPVELPASPIERHKDPAGYLADPGLTDAVNVALHLGQPLLLTGQPGTGKTQLAYSLAWELGFGEPLKFETKSTSIARDLFYTYDAVGRFYAANTGEGSVNAIDYIRFNALGQAILHANASERVRHLLGGAGSNGGAKGETRTADDKDSRTIDFRCSHCGMSLRLPDGRVPAGGLRGTCPRCGKAVSLSAEDIPSLEVQWQQEKRRSVVLIDEIDKAPRDFPNDLLNEVEGMYFKIPELRNVTVSADANLRPVLVITSNSEKNLAEAFLRRCVFYHIPFPHGERLERIVHTRLGEAVSGDRQLLADAMEVFHRLRDRSAGLAKKPSTSELLAWLRVITRDSNGKRAGIRSKSMVEPTLCSLVKTVDDRPKAKELLLEWLGGKRR